MRKTEVIPIGKKTLLRLNIPDLGGKLNEGVESPVPPFHAIVKQEDVKPDYDECERITIFFLPHPTSTPLVVKYLIQQGRGK